MKSNPKKMNDHGNVGEVCSLDPAKGSECGTTLWQRPKFDLRFLFLAMTLAAIWCALFQVQHWSSMIVFSVIMLTYLFGCPRTRRAVLWSIPAMYLPFAWMLVFDTDFGLTDAPLLYYLGQAPSGLIWLVLQLGLRDSAVVVILIWTNLAIFFSPVLAIRFSKTRPLYFVIPLALFTSFSSFMIFTSSYWSPF